MSRCPWSGSVAFPSCVRFRFNEPWHCAPVLCIGVRVLIGCLSDAPSGHGITPMVFLAGLLAQGLGALVLARGGARPHHGPCCCSHGLHATHVVEPMRACSIAMPGCLLGAVKARPWCSSPLRHPPPPLKEQYGPFSKFLEETSICLRRHNGDI